MSGYSEFSKSNNGLEAESSGRFPISKAKRVVAKHFNVSQAHAEAFLKAQGTTEWHHSSKFYNAVDYYDVSPQALKDLAEDFAEFEYRPEAKQRRRYLKCWRLERTGDVREWASCAYLTTRLGNDCYSVEEFERRLAKARAEMPSEPPTHHKAKERIYGEKLEAFRRLDQLLVSLKEEV